ncbi:unnamed protein product [Diatraea saccharalis]|uniref:Acyltransferase n=1 Tax=Diatraea saccharalis TaxID=40085 RepID=A0A9N9RCK0_9NEOP|nr:unnamed protein product [Diatraea saccharalis]
MFNIKWAPLNVPLRRRLQTLSIFCIVFLASYGIFAGYIFFIALLWTRLWWLDVLYILYALYNNCSAGFYSHSRSDWYRSWRIWKYCVEYYPIKLVKTVDLDPTKNYLAPSHPHGLLTLSQWLTVSSTAVGFEDTFPGLTAHMVSVPTRWGIPFEREIFVYGGGVMGTEECILYHLNSKKFKGNFVLMNPGGSAEVMLTRNDSYNLYLKNRKGFVRVALKAGASIVPVINFGENKMFDGVAYGADTLLGRFQRWVRDYTKFALIAPSGRGFFQYSFGMIPYRVPINVVVGAPIDVPQVLDPTREQIDEVHGKFVQAITDLFHEHKHKYESDPNIKLNIF